MTPQEIVPFLDSMWEARGWIVPCFLSDPGLGKTQSIYAFAKERGANVVEIIASQILPNEVSGITMPCDETHSMEIYDHARLSSLKDGDILFFDELLQASKAVQDACLTLIQERRMMSGKMLPDIMIVAAGNPTASPNVFSEATLDRFLFINVEYSDNEWISYMLNKYEFNDEQKGNICRLAEEMHYREEKRAWNKLTPRTAEKLISWGLVCNDRMMFKKVVINTLSTKREAARLIVDICTSGKTAGAQIIEAVSMLDQELANQLKKLSLNEMLELIQQQPNAEEILQELKEVEYV